MKIKQLISNNGERCFAVVLDSDEEAVEKLLEFAKTHDISAASFTGLGALSRVTLGFFELEKQDYRHINLQEQVELVSLIGNFATEHDQVRLHCHAVVSNREGHAFGGHLLKGYVRPTLEVVVIDSPAHLRRQIDPATGLALLVP
jgi:predicted DNA-binding protein with PD1-like motif